MTQQTLWIIAAASFIFVLGILGTVCMVVASKKRNTSETRPYPISERNIVIIVALAIICYTLILLAMADKINETILTLLGTLSGFMVGRQQNS